MSLKLYQFPHSPYCIPISLILKNAGIEFEDILVDYADRGLVARVTNGAYYQVPVITNEEEIIFESSDTSIDVAHYVDGLIQHDLFPKAISGIHEIVVAHIENELEGVGFKTVDPEYTDQIEDIGDRTMAIRHKERRFGRGCVEEWRANKETLLADFYTGVDAFKNRLELKSFLFGETPVYADYALYGVIGNVHYIPSNIRMDGREWLQAWMERLETFKLN